MVEEHTGLFAGIRYALGKFGGFSLYVGRRRFYPIQVAKRLPRLPDHSSGAARVVYSIGIRTDRCVEL
jgi:hypothetical protein